MQLLMQMDCPDNRGSEEQRTDDDNGLSPFERGVYVGNSQPKMTADDA